MDITVVALTSFIVLITAACLSIKITLDNKLLMKEKMCARNTKLDNVEYSKAVLDFVKDLTGQIAVIKFREFQDTHDFQKISKHNIEVLAKDIATSVHDAFNEENFSLDTVLFTREFYEKYIINISIILTKDLFEKSINNLE